MRGVIPFAVCTLLWVFTGGEIMILLTTAGTHFDFLTFVLVMTKSLTVIAPQRVWYKRLDRNVYETSFNIFW
jgi:hypothetical protein